MNLIATMHMVPWVLPNATDKIVPPDVLHSLSDFQKDTFIVSFFLLFIQPAKFFYVQFEINFFQVFCYACIWENASEKPWL